jgi:uncharacterized phage protein gp47/JayE
VFQKTFDELLDAILTDWRNQFPEADTSQGSLIFIKSACLASAFWGLYHYQEWISRQIFPDTADSEHMEHHAWVRGLSRRSSETDVELLARLLDYIRRPPAGGNSSDYIKWAKEVDYVAEAWCFPLAQGLGTVDVVITADEDYTGSEIPTDHALTGSVTDTSELKLVDSGATFTDTVRPGDIAVNDDLGTEAEVEAVDSDTQLTLSDDIFTEAAQSYTIKSLTVQVTEYIDTVRPVTGHLIRVLAPTIQSEDITLEIEGTADSSLITADITALMNALEPGESLYIDQIKAIAINNGATRIVSITPDADVTPDAYEMIRPGTITIS